MLPHTQTNQMPVAFHMIIAGLAVLVILAMLWVGGMNGLAPVIIGLVIVFGLSWLFSTLCVEVNSTGVKWHFRGKLFGGFIPVSDIREADVTYMSWHIGYGHRWTKRGTLYRAWGLDVVQIHRQKGKPVFLGASDTGALVKAIEAMQMQHLEMNEQNDL